MSSDEPVTIQLDMDSPEARAAAAGSLRLIAAVRRALSHGAWDDQAREIERVVAEVVGDEDDSIEEMAQRVADVIQGCALVAALATSIASAASGMDPLEIDLLIEGRLAEL
jgi:hypothetical protein